MKRLSNTDGSQDEGQELTLRLICATADEDYAAVVQHEVFETAKEYVMTVTHHPALICSCHPSNFEAVLRQVESLTRSSTLCFAFISIADQVSVADVVTLITMPVRGSLRLVSAAQWAAFPEF
jgi:pyrroline-5-carboxylate reductase